jgi:hypothetical protein
VLRGRLIAASKSPKEEWTKNMAQHDAPCKFQTYFMSVGIDINDAEWGRFVDGRTFPNKKNPHLSWSRKFNVEWETFWASKPLNDFTREEVEAKVRELAADPRFPSE